jgi:hypothetical protein
LKPERWGSPLVQEEKYQEKPVKREEEIIIIIIIIILMDPEYPIKVVNYMLDDRIFNPGKHRDFYLLRHVHSDSMAHAASFPKGTWGKVAGSCSLHLISSLSIGLCGILHPSPARLYGIMLSSKCCFYTRKTKQEKCEKFIRSAFL